MRYIYAVFLSITTIATFISCGGTIGNIEKYSFYNVSIDSLKAAVKRVNLKHPEFRQYDKVKYKEGEDTYVGDGDYYCTINDEETKYFFMYSYVKYDSPYDTFTDISLSSAAPYGEILYLEKNISFFKQRKYRRIFEDNFIKAVRIELKYTKSNK